MSKIYEFFYEGKEKHLQKLKAVMLSRSDRRHVLRSGRYDD